MSHVKWTNVFLLVVLLLALTVRGLTAYFINNHLADPAWFQSGTYALFERQAQAILDHQSSAFWIDDPSRTESAVYPPGFPLWIAIIYKISGHRSAAVVQMVQWVLDSLSVVLIVGIGATAYDYRAGLIAGLLAALSPLLALYGAVPLADAPTSWLILGAIWLLLIAAKREKLLPALLAGLLIGLSCWLRANAILLPAFLIAALMLCKINWQTRFGLSGAVSLGLLMLITPLLVRNAIAFHVLLPTGLGAGTNLWEGIGETDRAAEFGAVYGDQKLLEQERIGLGLPADETLSLYYPNGVERDRERAKKALGVIAQHPIWYVGVMSRRMAGVLKFAGTPAGYYGSSGINVTSSKCLPLTMQGGFVSLFVTVLGGLQSVIRYLALPLMIVGLGISLKKAWRVTLLVLSTILYYLVIGSALHTEIRYGLPMQALLFVFAGVTISTTIIGLDRLRT